MSGSSPRRTRADAVTLTLQPLRFGHEELDANRGLLLANVGLFLAFFIGMAVTGVRVYDQDQSDHGGAQVSLLQYMFTGDFIEATFENWESEFCRWECTSC